MKIAALGLGVLLLACSAAAQDAKLAQMASSEGEMVGVAACYSKRLSGHRTASGEHYNPHHLTMSSGTIPMGSKVKITNLQNQRSVVAVVNDHMNRHAGGRKHVITDVSREVCHQLAFPRGGEAKVSLEIVDGGPAPH